MEISQINLKNNIDSNIGKFIEDSDIKLEFINYLNSSKINFCKGINLYLEEVNEHIDNDNYLIKPEEDNENFIDIQGQLISLLISHQVDKDRDTSLINKVKDICISRNNKYEKIEIPEDILVKDLKKIKNINYKYIEEILKNISKNTSFNNFNNIYMSDNLSYQNDYEELNFTNRSYIRLINENETDIDILKSIINENNSILVSNKNNLIINDNKVYDNVTVIRKDFIFEDLIKTINYMKNNDLQTIKVKLTPKDLGEIDIEFIKNTKDSKLSITISNRETFDLVNKNIAELNKHISTLDIEVKEVAVELKTDNQNSFADNLNHQSKKNKSKEKFNIEIVDKEESENINDRIYINENINLLA